MLNRQNRFSRGRVLVALARLPIVRRPLVRERAVVAFRAARRARRLLFERLGSERYSRPALHGMDTRLAALLPHDSGVFVEAGANDGYRQSNTYYLERFRGWSGVLVESIPELAERCRRERPRSQVFGCALVARGGPDRLRMRHRGLMSSATSPDEPASGLTVSHGWEPVYEVDVPARTLTSVLDEARVDHVDLLSLDVEGHEVSVLMGFDLERFAPHYILVETNDADEAIEKVLGGRYELLERPSPGDALYRMRSQGG